VNIRHIPAPSEPRIQNSELRIHVTNS
jgi:hypothetical protein